MSGNERAGPSHQRPSSWKAELLAERVGLIEAVQRLGDVALQRAGEANVVDGDDEAHRRAGLALDQADLVEVGDRLGEATGQRQGNAAVGEQHRPMGVSVGMGDRAVVQRQRLVDPTEPLEQQGALDHDPQHRRSRRHCLGRVELTQRVAAATAVEQRQGQGDAGFGDALTRARPLTVIDGSPRTTDRLIDAIEDARRDRARPPQDACGVLRHRRHRQQTDRVGEDVGWFGLGPLGQRHRFASERIVVGRDAR